MTHTGSYSALIADPILDNRMRLKQATAAAPFFGEVHQFGSLRDTLQKISQGESWDIVFISQRFSRDQIESFVREAKKSAHGDLAAYVLVMDGSNQDTPNVARGLMSGIDGFLLEPYSVDSLVQIAVLASTVRSERLAEREKLAVKILVDEIIEHLDSVAFLKSIGAAPGKSIKALRGLCAPLKDLSQQAQTIYFETLLEKLPDAQLPRQYYRLSKYQGASERVKKKLEEKLLAQMEAAKIQAQGAQGTTKVMRIVKKGF